MKYVLFVCVQNAGRSQMAEAFFERHAPEDLRAESAGNKPADRVHPTVIEIMEEVGFDLSSRRPKKLLVEMQLHADWAVTMGCGDACPYVPTIVEDWDIPDPDGKSVEEVRAIRDRIEHRVKDLLANRAEDIRADATAHEARLASLLPSLVAKFEGLRTPDEIRDCADAVLSDYDDVPIRSHVLTIVTRRASECLRADTCAPLARPR